MATEFFPLESLHALIAHHIALIDRFDPYASQEFSLLFLKLDNFDNMELKKSIQIIFRDSDIIFNYGDNYIILLPKTDWNGAFELLSGLQEFLDQKLQDSIVTYPDDGESADELLANFKKVVKKSYGIDLKI
ncbi:MAG: hypothetical protein B6D59_01055 [Campylobacteraceae bacterium 4484_4]|nr:MAG: hypothetical protein B6D59_01055 [Campylobacteraceae bacterium 4484_4]